MPSALMLLPVCIGLITTSSLVLPRYPFVRSRLRPVVGRCAVVCEDKMVGRRTFRWRAARAFIRTPSIPLPAASSASSASSRRTGLIRRSREWSCTAHKGKGVFRMPPQAARKACIPLANVDPAKSRHVSRGPSRASPPSCPHRSSLAATGCARADVWTMPRVPCQLANHQVELTAELR